MKTGSILIVGRWRNDVAQGSHDDKKEVHGKAGPYQQTCLAIAPDFANAVVDNVGYRENQQASGETDASKRYLVCCEQVCCYQANAEKYAEKHKQHTYSVSLFIHFSCFLRGYQALFVAKTAAKIL